MEGEGSAGRATWGGLPRVASALAGRPGTPRRGQRPVERHEVVGLPPDAAGKVNKIARLKFRMLDDHVTGRLHVLTVDGPDLGHGGFNKIERWAQSV